MEKFNSSIRVKQKKLDPSDFYYNEDGLLVFTESYHIKRGFCCGSKCKHCPYIPKHTKGNPLTKKTN